MNFKALFRPGILKTHPYSPGKPIEEVQRELGLDSVVKLASNENPEGPIPEVVAAIQQAAGEINRYPDAACHDLTHALGSRLKVQPEQILFGNGSNEVVDMLIRALISPGENMVYAHPSFLVYMLTAGVHFECGKPVPLDGEDRHDLQAMAAAIDDNTKIVMLCNPNNPTGTYNSRDEFEAFLAAVPERVIVGVDEAYFEYATAEDYPDALDYLQRHPNVVALRTFSKIHSLAGLRIGYAVGHADLIAELHKTREPFNVSSLAQAGALACIDNWDQVEKRSANNRRWLEDFEEELAALGLEVVPSQTNFILVRAPGSAAQLTQDLMKKGVIVRPMHPFGLGDGAIRISVGLPEENRRCIKALKELL